MKFIEHFLLTGLIFVVIDAAWIAIVANKFYKREMGDLLRKKPDFASAIIFYLLYLWGLIYFVLDPGLAANSLSFVIKHAALLGVVMYATYDLTNLSTLKGWSRKLSVVDMIWGTVITAAISTISFLIFRP